MWSKYAAVLAWFVFKYAVVLMQILCPSLEETSDWFWKKLSSKCESSQRNFKFRPIESENWCTVVMIQEQTYVKQGEAQLKYDDSGNLFTTQEIE